MDRREALKKLAAGGATVAGATVISSSRAFAYDQPTQAGSISITAFRQNDARVRIRVTNFGSATCPASAVSGTASATFQNQSFSVGMLTTPGAILEVVRPITAPLPASVTTTAASIRKRIPGTGQVAFDATDSIIVTVNVRYRCTYTGASNKLDASAMFSVSPVDMGGQSGWIVTPI